MGRQEQIGYCCQHCCTRRGYKYSWHTHTDAISSSMELVRQNDSHMERYWRRLGAECQGKYPISSNQGKIETPETTIGRRCFFELWTILCHGTIGTGERQAIRPPATYTNSSYRYRFEHERCRTVARATKEVLRRCGETSK